MGLICFINIHELSSGKTGKKCRTKNEKLEGAFITVHSSVRDQPHETTFKLTRSVFFFLVNAHENLSQNMADFFH